MQIAGSGFDDSTIFVELSKSDPAVRERLASFKVPVRVITLDSLPTVEGPNGVKVRRDELRRIAQATIDATR